MISNYAYISASSSEFVTISGTPATLDRFFEADIEFAKDRLQLPVYGPYHAHHLHREVDAKQFIQATNSKTSHVLLTYSLALPLMSTSSGQYFDQNLKAVDLLAAVIDDILKSPLCLGEILVGCTNAVKTSRPSKCIIVSMGPNSAQLLVTKALESETEIEVVTHENLATKIPKNLTLFGDAPRTSKKPKLAVVGMAGRFPNAADHEKFWDLLEAGLDVHRKVRYFRFLVDA